jgi:hypothetical protein
MTREYDYAQVYYWRIELIEPDDPEDNRYVVLHGDDGEIVGPMTVASAQSWVLRCSAPPPQVHSQ